MIENNNINGRIGENEIAIIGFGVRFPGDVYNLDQFWDRLIKGVDMITMVDQERVNHSLFHNGEMDTIKLGQIRDWKKFDPLFFGISPKEACSIDPQQRILLKVAWETFEDAGIDPFKMKVLTDPTTKEISNDQDSNWKRSCIGKISIFPLSKELYLYEKEDMNYLLNKQHYYTTVGPDEIYESIKLNTSIFYGPSFRSIEEVKLSQDFILSKLDIHKETSVFDKTSFFNPTTLDVQSSIIKTHFPNGCVFQGVQDLKIFSSNFPKLRSDFKCIYFKSSYLKQDDNNRFIAKIKIISDDGNVLLSGVAQVGSLLKNEKSTPIIKHPNKEVYSSFWQPKNFDQDFGYNFNLDRYQSNGTIYLYQTFLPFVINLLFRSIKEMVPFINTDILSKLSISDLETNYLKDKTWTYLFRTTIDFLKQNIKLIQDNSELASIRIQLQLVHPDYNETFFFDKSIPMITNLLFGEPTEVIGQSLLSDGSLQKFYKLDFTEYLELLSNSVCKFIKPLIEKNEKRIIRILEIGSGTGTQTHYVLEKLENIISKHKHENEECTIEIEFTFSDISTSFFFEAKNLFDKFNSKYINIVYRVVNISKDFQQQNINQGYYDFLVMFLVLHVSTHIEPSLQQIYKSLKPGGRLIFVELNNKNSFLQDMLFGVFDQWWGFKDYELRSNHCCLDPDTWGNVLKRNGFVDTYITGSTENQSFEEIFTTIKDEDIIIFTKGIEQLTRETISSIDMEYTTINQNLLSKKLKTKHILLTLNSQLESSNFLGSSLIGVFRSFCEFNDLNLYSVDIDSNEQQEHQYIQMIDYICNPDHFFESEFVIRNNQLMVENWRKETTFSQSTSFETNQFGYGLDINLEPQLKPLDNLQAKQVLVRFKSIGLNFRDTLFYRGIVKKSGKEFSGEIISVHPSVKNLKVAICNGELGMIPIKEYSMKNVKDAYNFMIDRKNIGKIVITDFDDSILQHTLEQQHHQKKLIRMDYSINANRLGKTILITGQSGVSFESIKWMVNNCKEKIDLIVLSISRIKFELEFLQNQLIHQNHQSRIHFRQVDVSNKEQIKNAINDVYHQSIQNYRTIEPIESVFHFAFSLHDSLPEDITLKKFNDGHSAKTIGALNLHQLSLELKWNLKNFILCSSITCILGSPFQCVYISSNYVINSLSKYRRSIGLPREH
eukprot:gene5754-7160_t